MFYFCECSQESNGCVGYWRCSDGKRIVLRCDECEATWLSHEDALKNEPIQVTAPDYFLPGTRISMYGGTSGWATVEEIKEAGFFAFIKGEGKAISEVVSEMELSIEQRGDRVFLKSKKNKNG